MATTIPLPLGSYQSQDLRASCKRLVGCFSEATEPDAQTDVKNKVEPAVLRRMAGIRSLLNDNSGFPVRGMWEMAGVQYAVIGPQLYSITLSPITQIATLTAINNATSAPITGSSFVRMTDNGACLVILNPSTTSAWTYAPGGGGFQTLSAAFFTTLGAIDCWFIDSYIVFLALNGSTFFNDDGRVVSGSNQITFTTAASFSRQFGTDLFVGMVVDHREIVCFGTRTSEGFVNTGNPTGSPFSSAPDTFMQIGMHPLSAFSVALQDQSVFWVASDKTVRRRSGQTPVRVSNSGIDNILGTSDMTGCYAMTPTVYGHPLWMLTMPAAARTIVYDCLTQKWFEIATLNFGYWRPQSFYNGFGLQLMGDSQSGQIGVLDENIFTDFGDVQLCEITTQPVYDGNNRITHRRIEFVCTMGQAPSATQAPTIDLLSSDNSGDTFESFMDPQNLGTSGQDEGTGQRAFWLNCGQSRNRAYKFRVTDPTPLFTVDIQATLEGGKW